MRWLYRLEYKFGRYYIQNLMAIIVGGMVVAYVMDRAINLDITGSVVLKDNALISGNIIADDIASEPGTRINGTISTRSDSFDLDAEFDFGGDF